MLITKIPLSACLELANDHEEMILKIMAKHKYGIIRMEVAKNNNITLNVARLLAEDENIWVLVFLAGNPKTPKEILEKLANSEIEPIREKISVLGSSSTPKRFFILF